MAKRKSKIKCLLISSPKGIDLLQPILNEVIKVTEADIQLDLYSQFDRNIITHGRLRAKDSVETITSTDLILVDLAHTPSTAFFEIGVARAIGKPIVFISENLFLVEELPDFIRQGYFIVYTKKHELDVSLKDFFKEYLKNPKRFTPRRLIESESNSQIIVDLEKLEQRDFENLCFELLSRLGYKKLEWQMKDEFIDAITTLRKQDPDGFEYEEFWLISFMNELIKNKIFDVAIHEPEYFIERIYRNMLDSDTMSRSRMMQERGDVPVTILFIVRGKENYPKRLIREISRRDFRMNKRGYPFTIRIRWWDEQMITALVQNNLPLARKYFSSEALVGSSVRLSYEELYKQYADMNEELQKTNQLLISERNKIESLERDAAWKLLSFIAAHRLGNPIDAIDSELSNLRVALEKGQFKSIKEIIESMNLPVEKAKLIVSEFRSLSISQEIKPELLTSENLNELIRYAAKQATDKKIDVTFDLKHLPNISADSQKLSDCFSELVRNALHFVDGENPKITISTAMGKTNELPDKIDRTKQYIKIIFSDNGCGVPFDKKKLIFNAFETSYVHGTGLGLAICESMIEKHGGKIREIGKPNEGATFEIFLPTIQNKMPKT